MEFRYTQCWIDDFEQRTRPETYTHTHVQRGKELRDSMRPDQLAFMMMLALMSD